MVDGEWAAAIDPQAPHARAGVLLRGRGGAEGGGGLAGGQRRATTAHEPGGRLGVAFGPWSAGLPSVRLGGRGGREARGEWTCYCCFAVPVRSVIALSLSCFLLESLVASPLLLMKGRYAILRGASYQNVLDNRKCSRVHCCLWCMCAYGDDESTD